MSGNKDHLDFGDPLDRILPMATWPQTPSETMERLREGYLANRIPAVSWRMRAALIAASIVLVVGSVFLMVVTTSDPSQVVTKIEPVASKEDAGTIHVRDFTVRDRFLLMIVDEKTRESVGSSVKPSAPTSPIVNALSNPLVESRISAAKRLGSLNDPKITHELIELAQNDRYRREAVIALMYSRREEAREFLAQARRSSELSSLVRSLDVQISASTRL